MPIFEYECERCGHTVDNLLKPGVVPPEKFTKKCVKCKNIADHHHVISAPSFHLKGDCWSRDNYSSKQGDR